MSTRSDMDRIVSFLADRSSVLYRVHDKFFPIADIVAMEDGAWRDRLLVAVAKSGMSQRAISLAAGRAASYLGGILKEGKDPTVPHLVAILDVIHVSVSWIIAGIEVTAEEEELLRLYASLSSEQRAAFRLLAESLAARGESAT